MAQPLTDPVQDYLRADPDPDPQQLKTLLEQQYPQPPRPAQFKLATPEDEWRQRQEFQKAVSEAKNANQRRAFRPRWTRNPSHQTLRPEQSKP